MTGRTVRSHWLWSRDLVLMLQSVQISDIDPRLRLTLTVTLQFICITSGGSRDTEAHKHNLIQKVSSALPVHLSLLSSFTLNLFLFSLSLLVCYYSII